MIFMIWSLGNSYSYNASNWTHMVCFLFFHWLKLSFPYCVTEMEEEEYIPIDECDEKETCLYPSPAKKKLFSVHIRPHVGNLSDYPFCITPQQIVCL